MLDTLRYESEIKDADDVFASLQKKTPRADMLAMAEQLIGSRTEGFDPGKFKNHYSEALRELVKAKVASGKTMAIDEPEAKGAQVLDFMDALKRSLAGGKGGDDKAAKPDARKPANDKDKPPAKAAPAKTGVAKATAKKAAPKKRPA